MLGVDHSRILISFCDILWHIFFDRQAETTGQVVADVGDPESTPPDLSADQIMSGYHCAGGDAVGLGRRRMRIIAAGWAVAILALFVRAHTVHAEPAGQRGCGGLGGLLLGVILRGLLLCGALCSLLSCAGLSGLLPGVVLCGLLCGIALCGLVLSATLGSLLPRMGLGGLLSRTGLGSLLSGVVLCGPLSCVSLGSVLPCAGPAVVLPGIGLCGQQMLHELCNRRRPFRLIQPQCIEERDLNPSGDGYPSFRKRGDRGPLEAGDGVWQFFPSEHPIKDRGQGIDIGPLSDHGLAPVLFKGGIGRPAPPGGAVILGLLQCQDLHLSACLQEHIFRTQIAVDDPGEMEEPDPFQELCEQRQGGVERHPVAGK